MPILFLGPAADTCMYCSAHTWFQYSIQFQFKRSFFTFSPALFIPFPSPKYQSEMTNPLFFNMHSWRHPGRAKCYACFQKWYTSILLMLYATWNYALKLCHPNCSGCRIPSQSKLNFLTLQPNEPSDDNAYKDIPLLIKVTWKISNCLYLSDPLWVEIVKIEHECCLWHFVA